VSTIKSSAENLTLNADGSGNDIIFQSNGSNVATLDQAGTLTATTFTGAATDATKLPLAGGTLTGNTTIAVNASPTLKLKRTGNNAGNGNIECLGADDSVDYKIAFAQSAGIMSFDVGGTRMLGVTSSGLCFNSDSAAANALDDYEEGTWTPTALGGLASLSATGTCAYTKIGNICYINAGIGFSGSGTGSGDVEIGGLPFTPVNDGSMRGSISIFLEGAASNWGQGVSGFVQSNQAYIRIRENGSTSSGTNQGNKIDAGTGIMIIAHYRVA